MRERRTLLLIAFLPVLVLPPAAVDAKVSLVQPGPGTPFQDAIDDAAPGDTLRVAAGVYSEAIVVNKALRILGAPTAPYSIVDAGCAVANAVEIAADDVVFRGLIVHGGTTNGVDVQNRDHVQLDVGPFKTCIGTQNAINVVSSTRIKLIGCGSGGVFPVGLHLSGIPAGADILVKKSFFTGGDARGILIENSSDVTIKKSQVGGVTSVGIDVENSDGVRISRNLVGANPGGSIGILLAAGSDDNLVTGNEIFNFPTDVQDLGASNCWRRNMYTTGSVSTAGCP